MKLSPLSPQKLISSLWKLQMLFCPIIIFAQEPIVAPLLASSVNHEQLARDFHLSWSKAKASLKTLNSIVVQKLIPLLTNLNHPILQDSVDYCSKATACHALISLFVEDKSEELVNAILSDSQLTELPDSAYEKALLLLKGSYENFSLDGLDTFNNYFKNNIKPVLEDPLFDIFEFDIALEKYKLSHPQIVEIYASTSTLRYNLNLLKGSKGHG